MATIILTGGTGFVGSFLGVELLKKGNFVIFLARGKGELSPKDRIETALKFVNPSLYKSLAPLCGVVEGDITKEGLGLSSEDMEYLKRAKPSSIFNSAGSVEFEEKKADSTHLINVEGIKNLLKFAAQLQIRHIHQMSTLYVAGNREGDIFESDLFGGPLQNFNNVYEQTKAEAENLILKWSKQTNSYFTIYRLPIVIGDSKDGKTLTFRGFYGFFKPFWGLKLNIRERIGQDPRLQEAGISVDNGFVTAPLFVKCSNSSRIDLVPIDWVVRNIRLVSEKSESRNMIIHLSHPFAPSSREVIEQCLPILGLEGFKYVLSNGGGNKNIHHDRQVLNNYQRIVDSMTKLYFAYNSNKKNFVNSNLVDLLGSGYNPPPEISKEILKTELEYAIEQNFQKPSFA